MAKHRIGLLPGDGVGKEVIEAAMIVLDKLQLDAEFIYGDVGWHFWRTEGNSLPSRTVEMLKQTDACLFGAITSKSCDVAERELRPELQGKGLVYESAILQLRKKFNLHTNIRPCKSYPGNPLNSQHDIDIVVFRENTECMYAGVEFHPLPEEVREVLLKYHAAFDRFAFVDSDDIAVTLRIMTRHRCRHIAEQAFDYARRKAYRSVTAVEKLNVMRETSGLMLREAQKVSKRFSEIDYFEANIDHLCMWLLKNPQNYGVFLTSNFIGDILSKLCVQLVGGLGFGASANIGDDYALFEPFLGSAPRLAGQYKVNPIGLLLSVRMMLEYLSETERAKALENSIATTILKGRARTQDMGGYSSTIDIASTIAEKL